MQHRQRGGVWPQHNNWLVRGLVFMIVLTLVLFSCAPASGGNTTPGTTRVTNYVGAAPAGNAGIVYALRSDTGVPRWHSQTDASSLTLALANGVVYTVGSRFTSPAGTGSLSALRASDGWHGYAAILMRAYRERVLTGKRGHPPWVFPKTVTLTQTVTHRKENGRLLAVEIRAH